LQKARLRSGSSTAEETVSIPITLKYIYSVSLHTYHSKYIQLVVIDEADKMITDHPDEVSA
jgi:hypothetical protein